MDDETRRKLIDGSWSVGTEEDFLHSGWNRVDPNGPVSCIPKPGGSTQVSLPFESYWDCVIRWKDRAESAESLVKDYQERCRVLKQKVRKWKTRAKNRDEECEALAGEIVDLRDKARKEG